MWGSEVEQEIWRRTMVAVWAFAYEIHNESLVSDEIFDFTCLAINKDMSTSYPGRDNSKIDKWFKNNFDPSTGSWVHTHPNQAGLHRIMQSIIARREMQEFIPGAQKKLAEDLLKALDAHTAAVYDDGHRKHLGASLIGDPCSRKLWYGFRWVLTPTFIDAKGKSQKGRMMRLFNRGHKEEIRFVEWLRGIGCVVQEFQEDGKTQLRISDVNGHYGGSLDGIVQLPPKFGMDEKMLAEFKTSSEKYFEKLKKEGVALAKPVHFAQMSTYGKRYSLNYALYMCVNKNTDEIYVEIVKLNWNLADQLTQKAANVINSPVPPPKLSDNSAYFDCKMCDFASICHGQATYEKTCRSCVNAVPVANGEWHCRLYQQNIPADFIPKGCDAYAEAR